MKKILALMLAAVLVFSLAACGGNTDADSTDPTQDDAAMEIALVTDVGTINDESFNQASWQGVKAYAEENGIGYKYFQPAADSTEERLNSVALAVDEGAKVIVCPGYMFGETLVEAQETYPDVKFIAIDVTAADMKDKVNENVYCITFQEEQAGYLAGYAAVKDGLTKLGFLGGMAVPAVQKFGYGYVQGIDDAAQELDVDVQVKYTYGNQFFGDANITAKMDGWYQDGTEVVFACGGGIWTSAVEAAYTVEKFAIGVDVDQSPLTADTEKYSYNPFITSAVKGLQESVEHSLGLFYDGEWDTIAGKVDKYGLEMGDYVGLPTADRAWNFETFTIEDYEAIVADIRDGKVEVSDSIDAMPEVSENVELIEIA